MEKKRNTLFAETWVNEYSETLFKFAVARVGDAETAKDLVQDTFLSALTNLQSFKGEVSEKNWLFIILKNKIIDYYKLKSRKLLVDLEEHLKEKQDFFDEDGNWSENAKPLDWGVNYESKIEIKDFYKVLEECKKKLVEIQNAVFTLKYMDDMDSDEICKELEITSSYYWVLIHRAKLQLRACMESNWFLK